MSRERTPMRRIRQILEFRLGHKLGYETIAKVLHRSKGCVFNTCQRFTESGLSWPLAPDLTDEALESRLFPPASKEAAEAAIATLPDIGYIQRELARPHVTLQCLWSEYETGHPDGMSRASFYRYVNKRMPIAVTMRRVHKGGDMVYTDFSGDGLFYIDRETGEMHDVELFVCSWGASSYTYADVTESQDARDFTAVHVRALHYFGAAPRAFVPDNTTSAIARSDRYDPIVNALYAAMAAHYGIAVIPARVGKPRDKATVESNVLHAQRHILAALRNRQFFSIAEVREGVWEELEKFQDLPMKEYGNSSRRQRFEELDRPFAQTLPAGRFLLTEVKLNVRVGLDYHIRFNDHFYSVPWRLAKECVDVHVAGLTLEVYHGGVHCCRHQVQPRNFCHTTVAEHMPPNHAFVRGMRPEWFMAKAREIGSATAEVVETVMATRDHPQQGFNAAMGILRLARTFTPARLENACIRALHFKSISYRAVKAILEQGLDSQLLLLPSASASPVIHENIRGSGYYGTRQEPHTKEA